jgi:hypothetical protein
MKPHDKRFTLDGSDALEAHLARICEQVRRSVQSLIPAKTLEAIVLGGGYGRGEGGVFKTPAGDQEIGCSQPANTSAAWTRSATVCPVGRVFTSSLKLIRSRGFAAVRSRCSLMT